MRKENGVNAGETILVTGGTPGVRGTTSYLQLITVNKIFNQISIHEKKYHLFKSDAFFYVKFTF